MNSVSLQMAWQMRIHRLINTQYRWIIVGAGGILGCVAMGAMFSLPVLLLPIVRDTGWSLAGVSAAMTIGFISMALASIAWGTVYDRQGPRIVVLCGALIVGTCLALASRAHSLLAFQILFGIGVGGGSAAIFAPMMACVTGWFDTHRSLAVSLVSAGMGLAPMTMSPLAAWLITATHDWRRSLWMIAAVAVGVMLPIALAVRRPPAIAAEPSAAPAQGVAVQATKTGALRSLPFMVLLLTNFFCCGTMFHFN